MGPAVAARTRWARSRFRCSASEAGLGIWRPKWDNSRSKWARAHFDLELSHFGRQIPSPASDAEQRNLDLAQRVLAATAGPIRSSRRLLHASSSSLDRSRCEIERGSSYLHPHLPPCGRGAPRGVRPPAERRHPANGRRWPVRRGVETNSHLSVPGCSGTLQPRQRLLVRLSRGWVVAAPAGAATACRSTSRPRWNAETEWERRFPTARGAFGR